jgi:hypothetical protein
MEDSVITRSAALLPGSGLALGLTGPAAPAQPAPVVARCRVVEDTIPEPLAAQPGDAARGRAVAPDRARANRVTCVAQRCRPGELRLRVVDGGRINPDSESRRSSTLRRTRHPCMPRRRR